MTGSDLTGLGQHLLIDSLQPLPKALLHLVQFANICRRIGKSCRRCIANGDVIVTVMNLDPTTRKADVRVATLRWIHEHGQSCGCCWLPKWRARWDLNFSDTVDSFL
jgi:hypothetical protein